MKPLLLSMVFVCALAAQTLTSTVTPSTLAPGGTGTITISYSDSTVPSGISGLQFEIHPLSGLTFGTPIAGASVIAANGNIQCLSFICLVVNPTANTAMPSGVVMTIPVTVALTTVPGSLIFTTLFPIAGASGTNVNITSIPAIFTIKAAPQGIAYQGPNGQAFTPLGRGLYYDTTTTPPSIRTLSWAGLHGNPGTVWIAGANGDAQPVDLDTSVLQLVPSTFGAGRQMLTVNIPSVTTVAPGNMYWTKADGTKVIISVAQTGLPAGMTVQAAWVPTWVSPIMTISVNNVVGKFNTNDGVQGKTSGAVGSVVSFNNSILTLTQVVGTFVAGETITDLATNGTIMILNMSSLTGAPSIP